SPMPWVLRQAKFRPNQRPAPAPPVFSHRRAGVLQRHDCALRRNVETNSWIFASTTRMEKIEEFSWNWDIFSY
ncbi:hypothetical protein RZS08_25075, partial [Arthrospira platensis SPKY1]|nr:hypothetical protein [Arthrospira platensis SPKY1]